jgi:hypothetical protein
MSRAPHEQALVEVTQQNALTFLTAFQFDFVGLLESSESAGSFHLANDKRNYNKYRCSDDRSSNGSQVLISGTCEGNELGPE